MAADTRARLAAALLAAFIVAMPAIAEDAPAAPAAPPDAIPPPAKVNDPWEGWNRAMFKFNLGVDKRVLRPVAKGYRAAVPGFARTGISNFFDNLEQPLSSVNALLQGKPGQSVKNLGRFAFNLVIGLGGFLDPATTVGLESGDEDFGQTLGKWGVGDGPYLVLPFLPGKSLRDWGGTAADYPFDPLSQIEADDTRVPLQVFDLVEQRYRLLDLDEALDSAYDPYAFVRDATLQRRAYKVRDGATAPIDYDDFYLDPLDEPTPEDPAPEAQEPPPPW